MRCAAAICLVCAISACAQTGARAEDPARVRALVEAGALPRAELRQAELALADRRDEETLRRTLYGNLTIEDLTEPDAGEMVAAATRRLERERARLEEAKKLVAAGALPRLALTPAIEEMDRRRRTLDLAESRARLLRQLAEMVRVEEAMLRTPEASAPEMTGLSERYQGDGIFQMTDLERIRLEFERQFARPLPVSAHGATALHRALGFDHRGRVDVALDPELPEGRWLRGFLQTLRIPYFAFRGFLRGKSTGPHIHIGPPSESLRSGG